MTGMPNEFKHIKLNWKESPQDERDYCAKEKLRLKSNNFNIVLKKSVNLNDGFPKVYNQGHLGSCAPCAACAVLGYHETKHLKNSAVSDPSRLHLYYYSRKEDKENGHSFADINVDTGTYLSTVQKVITKYGFIHETPWWKYDIRLFAIKPGIQEDLEDKSELLFEKAMENVKRSNITRNQSYKSDYVFYRLDNTQTENTHKPAELLELMKHALHLGYPMMFGMPIHNSFFQNKEGNIILPQTNEKCLGGHAMVISGYDDNYYKENMKGAKNDGAFILKNSWGMEWGKKGYGMLSYEFVTKYNHLRDIWILCRREDVGSLM